MRDWMMWGDEDSPWTGDAVTPKMHPTEQAPGQRPLVVTLVAALALTVVVVGVSALFSSTRAPAMSSSVIARTQAPTATVRPRDVAWRDVGLSADEQVAFSHADAQTGYSCGVVNNVIVMHATHDGGTSWQLLSTPRPI